MSLKSALNLGAWRGSRNEGGNVLRLQPITVTHGVTVVLTGSESVAVIVLFEEVSVPGPNVCSLSERRSNQPVAQFPASTPGLLLPWVEAAGDRAQRNYALATKRSENAGRGWRRQHRRGRSSKLLRTTSIRVISQGATAGESRTYSRRLASLVARHTDTESASNALLLPFLWFASLDAIRTRPKSSEHVILSVLASDAWPRVDRGDRHLIRISRTRPLHVSVRLPVNAF
jgi:hypothetical protein